MAELGNGLNHITAIRQELEILVIIANRWVTEFLVVQLRRASPRDFKVRLREICLHAGKPISLTPRRQGARRLLKYWSGSRVEAEGRMARSEGGASPAAGCNDRATPPAALLPRAVHG